MMVVEYLKWMLGFLVYEVDWIICVDWECVKVLESVLFMN